MPRQPCGRIWHASGCVVSAQNGLNEPIIAEAVGVERTIGCFVNFGADYMGPAWSCMAGAAPSSSASSTGG